MLPDLRKLHVRRPQWRIDKEACDRMFSKIVRSRDPICRRCKTRPSTECAHIISRRYGRVRCELDNAWGLCAGCHRHVDQEARLKLGLTYETIGRYRYDELWEQANDGQKVDWAALRVELKARLVEVTA